MSVSCKNIIVIGGCHHNTLGVIRSLGEKGIDSHLVLVSTLSDPYIKHSLYIISCTQLKNWVDVPKMLLNRKDTFGEKPIIISCADPVTFQLDSYYDALSPYYIMPLGVRQGDIAKKMEKDFQMKIAMESGLKIPQTASYFTQQENLPENMIFPCIVKPLKSVEGSKADIAILQNSEEFQDYLVAGHCGSILIQEFIDKELEFQLIGCSLCGGEEVIIPGVSVILRQPQETNTGFLIYKPFSDFVFNYMRQCEIFLKKIGYSGLFSMEFLRDKSGNDYFMEINFRNDGNAICVTAAGVNLPYIWYAVNSNLEYKQEVGNVVNSVIVMPEFNDFSYVVKTHQLSFLHWLRDVMKTDRFMVYSRYDKSPFYILLRQTISRYILAVLKRYNIFGYCKTYY